MDAVKERREKEKDGDTKEPATSVGLLGTRQRNVGRFMESKERINQRRQQDRRIAIQGRLEGFGRYAVLKGRRKKKIFWISGETA